MKIKKQLKLIEKYYPGIAGLTNHEIVMYADYRSLHSYHLDIALRRREIKKLGKVGSEDALEDNNCCVAGGSI